ncbi:MAG: response regulator transcription factor [Bacteroidales bacterium]
MNARVQLTKRESEIAELFAWGLSKKEIAGRLHRSARTVENHARNIYEKTGVTKVNELSAWWFCTNFNISFDLSPLKRTLVSIALLLTISPQMFADSQSIIRTRARRAARTVQYSRARVQTNKYL